MSTRSSSEATVPRTKGKKSNGFLNFREHKWALIYCSYFVLGALLYGYDGTYFTGVQAMDAFKRNFGTQDASGQYVITSGALSIMTSIVYVGELIGSLSASVVQDNLGRKGGLGVSMVAVIIGAVVQIAAEGQQGVIIAGRIILGIGVGLLSNAVPQYLSEVPSSSIRGAGI